ncbi:MAG: membrane protein insertase YidC [Candidatus Wildermuthbacteria bacterium]|nr:membrane protein insertase YidC [Candidatus Wildermuthbacteria bacterium]
MDFFISLYHIFLQQPIFNALVFLSQTIPGKDFGVAVIVLTLLVRGISYPLGAQGVRAQKKLAELQPKIKEIQEKYKNKREEQSKAMFELYRMAKVNPFAMFLPLLIQLPIFIVLYQTFSHGIQAEQLSALYPFVAMPEKIDPTLFNLVDLNERSYVLAFLAGVLQFLQFKQSSAAKPKRKKGEKPDMASLMQSQMTYIFPVVIVWIAASMPAAFALYWVSSTAFTLWQYWFIAKRERYVEQRAITNN